jgi:ABC-type dipeptide/oligopeptide/nickel transport system permease subunit
MAVALQAAQIQRPLARPRTRRRQALRALRRSPLGVVGLLLVTLVLLTAIGAPLIAPHDPDAADITHRLQPPAWLARGSLDFPLGTDQQGRDVLSRLIFGSRVSLLVGFLTTVLSGSAGALLGLLAGYFGGAVDSLIMRVADVQLALPFILLAIAVMAVLQPSLTNVILVLAVTGWVTYARLVRAETLGLREREFVTAARAAGANSGGILWRHVLPNVLPTLVVWATLRVGAVIVLEATLTFLGLGVEASIPTWGRMLSDGRAFMQSQWWLTAFPGLAILLTVLGINLFGDWLRDWLDPRLR